MVVRLCYGKIRIALGDRAGYFAQINRDKRSCFHRLCSMTKEQLAKISCVVDEVTLTSATFSSKTVILRTSARIACKPNQPMSLALRRHIEKVMPVADTE